MPKKRFFIINGPSLNLLGTREVEIYGDLTLDEIRSYTESKLETKDLDLQWFQSNLEGEIINWIQRALKDKIDGLIINPGGYSHSSVAIYDALKLLECPVLEVHLSNLEAREEFRGKRITAKAASGVLAGLGKNSYYLAVLALLIK